MAVNDSSSSSDTIMLDPNSLEQRPTLSTSLSDFALFASSTSAPSSPSALSALEEGINPFFRRLRRSSLLASASPIIADANSKHHSPLAASFVPRPNRRIDSEKMSDDSSSQSESTPSSTKAAPSHTPNRRSSSIPPPPPPSTSTEDDLARRLALPPKPARLLDIRSEINSPIDAELKSEAQFQRLIASYANSGLPMARHFPRTPRAWSDRGRFPEEAGHEDEFDDGEGSDSDDDDIGAASVHSMSTTPSGMSVTPTGSGGEDQLMSGVESNGASASASGSMMDIDMPSSHSTSAISSPTQWRQTPPPTSRPPKRKFDDRYDPYPTSKRRAVSPALHHPHSHHSHSRSGSFSSHPTLTLPIPIPIPRGNRSVTSSPVMRPVSSPIMRPSSFGSPTMRPIARLPPLASLRGGCGSDTDRERESNRKSIDGAGEAVGSLTLS